jgi:hypothetical protein
MPSDVDGSVRPPLVLCLAARAFSSGDQLPDSGDGKAHEIVTWTGNAKHGGNGGVDGTRIGAALVPERIAARVGGIEAVIESEVRGRPDGGGERQAAGSQVETVDLRVTEFVEGRRVLVAGEKRNA